MLSPIKPCLFSFFPFKERKDGFPLLLDIVFEWYEIADIQSFFTYRNGNALGSPKHRLLSQTFHYLYFCIILFLQSEKSSSGRIVGFIQNHRTGMRQDRLRRYWRPACPVIIVMRCFWSDLGTSVYENNSHPASG